MLPDPSVSERGPFAGGAVPVPNVVIDEVLPTLKDTELRVLLVVLRQTVGWRDAKGRSKTRDWLSHSQLVRRTGRGSDAISSAIATLVKRGLITVETSAGVPLATTGERRRYLGRLYFRLGRLGENAGKSAAPRRPAKPKTTTNTLNNKKKTTTARSAALSAVRSLSNGLDGFAAKPGERWARVAAVWLPGTPAQEASQEAHSAKGAKGAHS